MTTLLVQNAEMLVTMDTERREIAGGGLFARDGVIEQVGPTAELPATADTVLDLAGHIVLPGLINTHHHLYQGVDPASSPAARTSSYSGWLKTLYPHLGRPHVRSDLHLDADRPGRAHPFRLHHGQRSSVHLPQ